MTLRIFASSTLHQQLLRADEKHRTQHQTQNEESSTYDLEDLIDASA